jgi:hypothetical protein
VRTCRTWQPQLYMHNIQLLYSTYTIYNYYNLYRTSGEQTEAHENISNGPLAWFLQDRSRTLGNFYSTKEQSYKIMHVETFPQTWIIDTYLKGWYPSKDMPNSWLWARKWSSSPRGLHIDMHKCVQLFTYHMKIAHRYKIIRRIASMRWKADRFRM